MYRNVKAKLYFLIALVAAGLLLTLLAQPATAHAQDNDTARSVDTAAASPLPSFQITESTSATWDVYPTADGAPATFRADVTASADIRELVVDVYLDGVLIDSIVEPSSIMVDLIAYETQETGSQITVVGREVVPAECERLDGVVSFSNARVSRVPHAPTALAGATAVTISGSDPIAVANLAAAAEREMVLPGATVALDAPVVLEVTTEADDLIAFSTVDGLADQATFSAPTSGPAVDADLRTIQVSEIDLDRNGGSSFVSATGFGGRVADVRVDGEIHSTPLAAGGGFAIEVNEEIVVSGDLDEDGFGTFTTTVEDWPRDAQVAVHLALREDRSPCSAAVSNFAGTAEMSFTPLPSELGVSSVDDFPQQLLEGQTISLWVDNDVEPEWVAVAVAALQDTSVEPLRFHRAPSSDDASLVISAAAGGAMVRSNSLVLALDDDMVDELIAERFWNVGIDDSVAQTSVVADEVVSIETPGFEAPRAGWIFTTAIGLIALAILLLFLKNSRQAP